MPTDSASLGPFPPGDPGAMRGYATQLRADAAELRSLAHVIDSISTAMPFTAPVADRVRQAVGDDTDRLAGLADRLDDVAQLFQNAAGDVEASQTAWRQRDQRLRELQLTSGPGAR
jgi:hypothetical protein